MRPGAHWAWSSDPPHGACQVRWEGGNFARICMRSWVFVAERSPYPKSASLKRYRDHYPCLWTYDVLLGSKLHAAPHRTLAGSAWISLCQPAVVDGGGIKPLPPLRARRRNKPVDPHPQMKGAAPTVGARPIPSEHFSYAACFWPT